MLNWEMEILSPATYLPNSSWLMGQNNSGNWNLKENKLFEEALAIFDKEAPDRWQKVANMIPGKTVEDVMRHYKELLEDVSYIEAGLVPIPGYSSSSFTLEWADNCDFNGLKQSFGASGKRSGARVSDQERKKGVPWTEEEHRLFLMGLKKYGKGDWRNISRNFVVSRTPTQVASHAQKYFIRLSSGGKDKRRSSIHDITTANMPENRPPSPCVNMPENRPPSPSQPPAVSAHHSSLTAAPDQFSVNYDSNQPNESSRVFNSVASHTHGNFFIPTSHANNPYGRKFESQDLYRNPLHESMVGHHNMLFQMESTQHHLLR